MEWEICKNKGNSGEMKRGNKIETKKRVGWEDEKVVASGLGRYTHNLGQRNRGKHKNEH
jgi:hypothetical protein